MVSKRIPVTLLCLGRDSDILRLGLSPPRRDSLYTYTPPRQIWRHIRPSSSGGNCHVFLRCLPAAWNVIAGCRPHARRLLCDVLATCNIMCSCSLVNLLHSIFARQTLICSCPVSSKWRSQCMKPTVCSLCGACSCNNALNSPASQPYCCSLRTRGGSFRC